jgi:flavin reductase (DIM6/NTAB) family NADH-FMN oxidoreductase RutF
MDAARFSESPMLSVNPAECEPRQIYKLMAGIIVPRPVALVSTVDAKGVANLAPFSFFSGVGSAPPTVLFCPALRPSDSAEAGERKDTLRNVEETGEFVINVVSEALASAANAAAAEVAPGVDEFLLAGLTAVPSLAVRPPRVAESPAQMECRLLQVIYTGHAPASGVIVLGEVVRFHLRADLVEDFRVDPAALDAVGRMAGNTWVRTRDRMELIRPK